MAPSFKSIAVVAAVVAAVAVAVAVTALPLLLLLFRTQLEEGVMCMSTLPDGLIGKVPVPGHRGLQLPATPAPPSPKLTLNASFSTEAGLYA